MSKKRTNNSNYYMEEGIGVSGVAPTGNPAFLSSDYQPFLINARRRNVGLYYDKPSQYDENLGDLQGAIDEGLNIGDLRADAQSGWDMAANAVVNNIVTAGTTAISGTLGLVDGIFEALLDLDFSKIWDNTVTNAMTDYQNYQVNELTPIYRGKLYENSSLFEKLGTGIFWADLVQNLGFTEGMLIPGVGISKLLTSAPKFLRMIIPSFVSSMGEASQEAVNSKNDEINYKLLIALQRFNELSEGQSPETILALSREYDKTMLDIESDAKNAGNFVFGANVALLSLTNTIEFGNLFSRGFSTAKRLKGALYRKGEEYAAHSTLYYTSKAAGKKLIDATSEGFEEVAQAVISNTPINYTDYNSFNDSQFNTEKRQLAGDLISAMGQSYAEKMNDPQTAEEFASGFIIGLLGVPTLRKGVVPIKLENNIFSNIYDAYTESSRLQELADRINNRLSNSKEFNAYYNGLVRHLAIEDNLHSSLNAEDNKNYKDTESALLLSDIKMFDEAGDIDKLKELINNSIDMSDEGIQSLIDETTKDGEGPFTQNGNKMSVEDARYIIEQKKLTINETINNYLADKEYLESNFPSMDDETLNNALFLKLQRRDQIARLESLIDKTTGKINGILKKFYDSTENKKIEGLSENFYLSNHLIHYGSKNNENFSTSIDSIIDTTDDLSQDEKIALKNDLKDITRLRDSIGEIDKSITDIIKNPFKSKEDLNNSILRENNKQINKKSNSIKEALNNASSLTEIENIINNTESTEDRELIESILLNDTDINNPLIKVYKETSQYNTEVRRVINESDAEPQAKQDAMKLLQDQFNNSENLEQLANPNSIYINNENAFDEDSEGDVELSATRFQNAQYELQRAMSKINNDNKFKDRFSPEYKKPVEKVETPFEFTIRSKDRIQNHKVSIASDKTDKDGIRTITFKDEIEDNLKGHRTSNNGAIKLSLDDIDVRRYAANGRREDGTYITEENVTDDEIKDAEEDIKDLLYNPFTNPLNNVMALRLIISPDGKVFADIRLTGGTVRLPLKGNPLEKSKIKGDNRNTTGDSGTTTVPPVDTSTLPVEEIPVGNITQEMVAEENKKTNERIETPQRPSRDTLNQFYRPAIPELHIEGSKEGDFRPFVDVVAEREKGADFSDIYNYLRDKGAFEYLNQGKLHVGDEIGFMIDPEFEERVKDKEWHKAPTIFMIDKKTGQVVGSLDESDYSVSRYEGLKGLEERVRSEYANRTNSQVSKDDLIHITNTSQGLNHLGSLQEWSKKTSDIRTEPDGFGTKNGLYYYKQSSKGGRGGDNITIWFRAEPSQKVKDNIEQLLNDSKNLNEFGDKLANLIRSTQSKGKFVATPTTKVSKIMVGKVPYDNTERNLKDILNVSSESRKPIFGIIKNGVLTTNGKINDNLIIKPVDMAQKEGRLYLLIPNGAGKYSPTAVRVKHFNNEEFNLDDASVANTPMGKDISAAITKLANATSQDDVSQAMQDLAQDLYMQDVMVTWFDGRAGSGIVISKKVRKPDGTYEKVTINGKEQIKEDKYDVYFSTSKKSAEIGGINFDVTALEDLGDTSALGTPKDPNDIYKEMLGHLTKFNLPLQVSTRRINNGAYNNRLINSGILTSNITDASVRSTWFTTDYFDNEGNLHQAISPASVTPQPKRKVETPVGGTEGAIAGTKITSVFSNKTYYVDLKTNTIRDDQGKSVEITNDNRILFDLAWAQDNFGSSMNSTVMVDNKVLTPSGQVLDRTTQKYITGQEAQDIKDAIAGRKKEREDRVARSKEVISEIYENQKKVDKTRTDGEFYYVLEDDGQYHEYSRVHSRLGSNWVESPKQTEALTQIRTKLSQLVDTPAQYNNYLKFLENKYKINLEGYKDKTDAKSRDAIINIVRDLMSGTNSMRALNAGTAVDSVIRQYFTVRDVSKIVRPNNMTENAFIDLITNLNRIKSNMEQMGERFLADNIVLFQKYPDGTRVAGEIDILSVDKDGNFKIYDVKTSRYSFYEFTDRYGHKVNYFTTPSATQRMSAKNYYTLQLSAYKNLFESQYGVPITKLAVMPFVLNYEKEKVSGVLSEKGIPIPYNPAVNVPLVGNVKVDKPVKTPTTSAQESPLLPIYDSSLELLNPIEDLTPEHKFTDKDKVGYFELDGKLHKGYITPLTTINGIEVYLTKVPNITSGFGRQGETAHVASNSYYAVFTNGKTFLALENNPVQGGYSQSQVEQAVSKMLEGNPQKVKDMSNEKTILFDPNAVSTINTTPITTVETPATINQGNTLTGAAYTAQKEQAVMEHDDEFEDEFSLYESRDDDFFNNDDWGKNIKKIQGLNLEVGKEYTLDTVEELFNRFFEGDSEQKALADRVFKVAKSLGLKIKFDNNFGFGVKGQYANNNIIRYNHKFFTDDFLNNTKSAILLHEVIHATTMYILSDNMLDRLEGNLKEAADAIKEAFDLIKGEKSLAGEYGLTNAKEMIAELANSQFRNKLKKVGIWDRIKNAIKKLFFFDTKPASNAYEVLSRALDVALDNLNIDLYNDYNGVVNDSDVGFNPNEWAFYKSVSNTRKAQISSEVRTWYSSNVFNNYNINMMIDTNNDGYILLDYLYTFHYNKNTGDVENITPVYKNTDYNRNRINKWRERFDKRVLGNTEVAFYSSWGQINEEAKNILSKKGWTEEHWGRISQEERDHALKCVAF